MQRSNLPHSPEHRFYPGATYMVTAATLYKQHFFRDFESLKFLESGLLEVAADYGWDVEAWSVFSNHYHFVGQARERARPLDRLIRTLHSETAVWVNRHDGVKGRGVWYQYWDRILTFEVSYYARLNYVTNNAVHRGLVRVATQYPLCSARRFERLPGPELRKISSFGYERVKERDDFAPLKILE